MTPGFVISPTSLHARAPELLERLRAPVRASAALVCERTNLQAALVIGDRLLLASSSGRGNAGHLAVFAGADSEPLAVHDWAVGPEDLSYMRKRDLVVSLTEHPNREDEPRHSGRVVFGVGADSLLGGR